MEQFIINASPWREGTIFHIDNNFDVIDKRDFRFLECMIPTLKEMTKELEDEEIKVLIYNPFAPDCDFPEKIADLIMDNTTFQYRVIDQTCRFEIGKEE